MQNEMSHKEYWDKKGAQMDADIAADHAYSKTLAGRMEMAQRHLNVMTADAAAYTDEQRAEAFAAIATLEAEGKAAEAQMRAAEDAEWTAEVTAQRRAAWNAAIKSGKYARGRTVAQVLVERDLGFGFETLRLQVARHSN
jgi:hypothetical protein